MQLEQLVGAQGLIDEDPPVGPATSWGPAGEELTQLIRDELRWRYGRHHQCLIDALRVQVAGDAMLIVCASSADMTIIQNEMFGAIRCILTHAGVSAQAPVHLDPRGSVSTGSGDNSGGQWVLRGR